MVAASNPFLHDVDECVASAQIDGDARVIIGHDRRYKAGDDSPHRPEVPNFAADEPSSYLFEWVPFVNAGFLNLEWDEVVRTISAGFRK